MTEELSPLQEALEKHAGGRPPKKSVELCARILIAVADGQYLKNAIAEAGIAVWTWHRWLKADAELSALYTRACEIRADALFEEIERTAKDGSDDWQKRSENGEEYYQANHEHINRSRLITDTLKWKACKLAPKKYGDKVDDKEQFNPALILDVYNNLINTLRQPAPQRTIEQIEADK
jgi:hypothetical protein